MALFGLGNILLKTKRAKLPRPEVAPLPFVLIAISAVIIGLIGNAMMNLDYLVMFMEYFIPSVIVVSIMLGRIAILRGILFLVRSMLMFLVKRMTAVSQTIRTQIDAINAQQIVFFTRGDNLANLNQAMLYVRQNEHTSRIKVVTVVSRKEDIASNLQHDLDVLDKVYPEIDIEFVPLFDTFGPELISRLSKEWNIPPNLMFIGSPGTHFIYGLADLGGVRLII
jgi:hypothetical protein